MKKLILILITFGVLASACAPVISASTDNEINSEAKPQAEVALADSQSKAAEPNSYSIEALRSREYGQGELRVEYPWHNYDDFTRYYITYDSDGLNIHGFVNVPKGQGPFPVVIALHGYIPASEYKTLDYSYRYADAIARQGYIVLHPNMRNFPPSDSAERVRDFNTGYTVDVMNLLKYVQEEAEQKGSIFEKADLNNIGIWGHSLGGGVALRVISLVPEIKAAVLYAAVTQRYSNESAGFTVYDLESSNATYSVHHGTADDTIDVSWSRRFCSQLEEMGKEHECFFYEGAPHTFFRQGEDDPLFIERTIAFLDRYLKNQSQ